MNISDDKESGSLGSMNAQLIDHGPVNRNRDDKKKLEKGTKAYSTFTSLPWRSFAFFSSIFKVPFS